MTGSPGEWLIVLFVSSSVQCRNNSVQAEAVLQRLLSLDDYIKETASAKLTMELMLWHMREPLFDVCESEMECTDLFDQAKD